MKSAKSVRRMVLSLIGVFITVGAVSGVVQAAQSTPDFAIAISPTSQSVQRGQTASYTVNVTSLNGFAGKISLSTSGGPTGGTTGIMGGWSGC